MMKIDRSILALILVASPSAVCAQAGSDWSSTLLNSAESVAAAQTLSVRSGDEYPTNVDENQNYTRNDRHLDGVSLNGSVDGAQRFDIAEPRKVYTKALHRVFTVKAGEKLSPIFHYSGNWMNGYVYLDVNQDGKFDTDKQGGDILVYSNLEGENSNGDKLNNQNVLNPPAFTLPQDMPSGIYRMRYKVDWSSIDPAGRKEDGNGMLKNGGAICDVLLNVHGDFCEVTASHLNGEVLQVNGERLETLQAPFGKPLTIKVKPAKGFVCEGIRIRHGYNLSGDSLVNGNPQYVDVVVPAYLFREGTYTIPAQLLDGDVKIEGLFVADGGTGNVEGDDYALNFDRSLVRNHTDRTLNSVTFRATQGGKTNLSIPQEVETVYQNRMNKAVSVVAGDEVNLSMNFQGSGVHYYLYVDFDQNGHFSPMLKPNGMPSLSGELVSYSYYKGLNSKGEKIADPASLDMMTMPAFKVPELLPNGNYRARLKVDVDNVDPAGQSGEGEASIDKNGGYVIDFLLNVHSKQHPLTIVSTNGSIHGTNNTGLPMTVAPYSALTVVPTPAAVGYVAEKMVIKHGHHFDGPQFIHGNRQWSEYEAPVRSYNLPKDSISGDIEVSVHFVKGENAVYELVFSDEFNGENFTEPTDAKWRRCERQGATWNRWLSDSKEVVYMKDGNLVTRAIPNPDQKSDPVPMITGGVKSQKKFGFTYGKVECRAKVESWVGTFPAIWLMPEDQSAGWPSCGEIDIFEAIDAQQTAYGTVHSHWTYDLGHKNDPRSAFNTSCSMDRYHTYGFEWDERSLRWYVDGKLMGTYTKSTSQNALNQGQWPFDKHFYLILNQSVGNGSWAKNPDLNHTYEFLIDWVRVYQKPGMENTSGVVGLMDVNADDALSVEVFNHGVVLNSELPLWVRIHDLQGRCLFQQQLQGEAVVNLSTGVYLVNGQKVFVR